jgi:uncharacterized protein (TIGR02996 family)
VSTEAELIAACLARPNDDTCRLALADWYDEEGTSDQQAARAEWIRLTSDRKRPNGRRLDGEPAWMRANAHRLWPTVWKRITEAERKSFGANHRHVRFRVPVPLRGSSSILYNTIVSIDVTRGVAAFATMDFHRAAHVAHLIAADEPLAPLRIGPPATVVPHKVTGLEDGRYDIVYRRGFSLAGLAEVWDGLEGWNHEVVSPVKNDSVSPRDRRLYDATMHQDVRKVVYAAINNSFTRWARTQAGVPHVVLPSALPADDARSATKLIVPIRIPFRMVPPPGAATI